MISNNISTPALLSQSQTTHNVPIQSSSLLTPYSSRISKLRDKGELFFQRHTSLADNQRTQSSRQISTCVNFKSVRCQTNSRRIDVWTLVQKSLPHSSPCLASFANRYSSRALSQTPCTQYAGLEPVGTVSGLT